MSLLLAASVVSCGSVCVCVCVCVCARARVCSIFLFPGREGGWGGGWGVWLGCFRAGSRTQRTYNSPKAPKALSLYEHPPIRVGGGSCVKQSFLRPKSGYFGASVLTGQGYKKPNILVIIIDDMGWNQAGTMGGTFRGYKYKKDYTFSQPGRVPRPPGQLGCGHAQHRLAPCLRNNSVVKSWVLSRDPRLRAPHLNVCIYTYIHIYIHVCICMHVYVCIHTYRYIYIYLYLFMLLCSLLLGGPKDGI